MFAWAYLDRPGQQSNQRENCPICSGKRVLPGFNDSATTHPELAAEADGWDPTRVGKGHNTKLWWKCSNAHRWSATVNARTGGSGCPSCAQTGYDPNQHGWLYLIEHDEMDLLQIGISNFLEKRLAQHSRRGWHLLEVRGPMDGHLAQQLETAILHSLERRGATMAHKTGMERFGSYSEAWAKTSLAVEGFKQLLDWVYEDDLRRD